ncbi:adhesion G-protein coupled receptor G1-like, partial [Chiloscyllium plagiosum]|uniref:adhesion G-protein coupled receptor G1-like n=1 Tax=Chiloscyllium plagiosum TaxID=36176 RepID=UPI001CB87B8F
LPLSCLGGQFHAGCTLIPFRNASYFASLTEIPIRPSLCKKSDNNSTVLNNLVSGIEVVNVTIENLTDPVTIVFQNTTLPTNSSGKCVFWDFRKGSTSHGIWSESGCTTESQLHNITCKCTHLTSFAVLLVRMIQSNTVFYSGWIAVGTINLQHAVINLSSHCGLNTISLWIERETEKHRSLKAQMGTILSITSVHTERDLSKSIPPSSSSSVNYNNLHAYPIFIFEHN